MAESKKNVTDKVYEELFNMLLKSNYKPGQKLPSENELKDTFGVSRNTIRSAINRLNVLGIVETRQGEGTYLLGIGTNLYLNNFVPSILTNADDLMGLLEFRRGVETASARLAAMNATDEDIADMERYFEALKNNEVSNHEFAEMTSDFHVKIAMASKNELFVNLLNLIKWIITSRMEDFLYYKPNVADSSFYHYMVYRCIRQHKPDEAAYMMDCHIKLLIQRVDGYIQYTNEQKEEEITKEEKKVIKIFGKKEVDKDE